MITQLTAENIKRLKAIRIKPDGSSIVIGGNNAQGKSSVIDSIIMGIGGKGRVCEEPIRRGEDAASVTIELEDLTITRRFTGKGSTLEVTGAKGEKITKPQTLLDRMTGRLTFDPLDFTRMKPKEQADMLAEVVGLNFTSLDEAHARAYERRRETGRELKTVEGLRDSLPRIDDAPTEPVGISELQQQHREATERALRRNRLAERVNSLNDSIDRLERQIADLKAERDEAERQYETAPTDRDPAEIQAEIDRAHQHNDRFRDAEHYRRADAKVKELATAYQNLTAEITGIANERAEIIEQAKFPVPGLAINPDGIVTYNGLPFEQCSQAERLRISIAIGIAANPDLKVLLIKDGALLDSDHLAMVERMAADADAQVWIERVGEGQECQIIIRDGEIAEDRTVQ